MNLRKNHEMLLHFVMAFIGGYFGLYAIVARNDLFGSAQTSNLIYLVQDIVGGRPLDFVIRIGALVRCRCGFRNIPQSITRYSAS